MKKLFAAALAAALMTAAPALAQVAYTDAISGVRVTKPVTPTTPLPVQDYGGGVAAGATDSGNPVKVGGVYNSTKPTYTNGQRGDAQIGTRGALIVQIGDTDGTTGANIATINSDAQSSVVGLITASRTTLFSGSGWDRAFTCTSTAAVSVTAGNTTQIVALASSQIVRVCSVTVSMSAAGTAKFVYGTGANCGTGTTDIMTAMNLATATPWAQTAPTGGSLFRTAASNALCLTAATGNVVGFITYAQF